MESVAQGVTNGLSDPLFEPLERMITDQLLIEKSGTSVAIVPSRLKAMNIASSESHPRTARVK
jgi:hypothetical protein